MTIRAICLTAILALLAGCAPAPEEEPPLPAPVIAPEVAESVVPAARKAEPLTECATNDGIGGTGCPQID